MAMNSILVRCLECGTKNRIPGDRLNDAPVCGKCRASLKRAIGTGKPMAIGDAAFQKEVIDYPGTVLVDCWAPWCGPCRSLAPVLDELAAKYRGRVKIVKLNTDENPGAASRYVVKSIPTMLIFKNGTQVNRLTGALPRTEIERHLAAAI